MTDAPATHGAAPTATAGLDAEPGTAARPAVLRAFVNERGVDVAPGGTALDAVRAFDALAGTAHAESVVGGGRLITDSRGLPVDPAAPAHGGAIYRLVPARSAPNPAADPDEPDPAA